MEENVVGTSTRQIVIIDDDANARHNYQAFLAREGYQMHLAENGVEGIEIVHQKPADLIILDVMMPKMDGFEVCRLLKSDNLYKHIPVIMITALSGQDDLIKGLEAGADEFLSKPVKGAELRARVQTMLRLKAQYDELRENLDMREKITDLIVNDLKNPLTAASAYQVLLKQGDIHPVEFEFADRLWKHVSRMNEMLNDMLIITKLRSGKPILNRSIGDLNQLLRQIRERLLPVAMLKNIDLEFQIPDQKKLISIDKNLIQATLDSLITHAIKLSLPDTHIRVVSEYLNRTPGRMRTLNRITIADEGPGIPESVRKIVFQNFDPGSWAPEKMPRNCLNLAFSRMVMKAHGGQLAIKNNSPKGTIFTMEF